MVKKAKNTFHFIPFTERISQINVDIVRRYKRFDQVPEDADSFFEECLCKWKQLDCTEQFEAFLCEIPVKDLSKLVQLIHFKDPIVSALLKHLQAPDTLCLPALLDLVVALCRDLQQEFYAYFWDFFDVLSSLLFQPKQDPELLDHCFTTLAYLLKFMWRPLVDDSQTTFVRFLPLIQHKKDYIRRFSSEAFSFLLRKLKELPAFIKFCIAHTSENNELKRGIAQLFFQSVKGLQRRFHSCGPKMYKDLLCCLKEGNDTFVHNALSIVVQLTDLMMRHTDKDNAKVMISLVVECIRNTIAQLSADGSADSFGRVAEVLNCWLDFKEGVLMSDLNDTLRVLQEAMECSRLNGTSLRSVLKCLRSCLCMTKKPRALDAELCTSCIEQVFRLPDVAALADFVRSVLHCSNFDTHVLPPFMDFLLSPSNADLLSNATTTISQQSHQVITILAEILENKYGLLSAGNEEESPEIRLVNFVRFPLYGNLTTSRRKSALLTNHCLECLQNLDEKNYPLIYAASVILPHLVTTEEFQEPLRNAMLTTSRRIHDANSMDSVEQHSLVLLGLITSCLIIKQSLVFDILPLESIMAILKKFPSSLLVLRLTDLYMSFMPRDLLSKEHLLETVSWLQLNLSSPCHAIRMFSLRILSRFPCELQKPRDAEIVVEQIPLFELCLVAENTPATLESYREKIRLLRKLSFTELLYHLPAPQDQFQQVAIHFLFGQFHVNLTPLWPEVVNIIGSVARGLGAELFLTIFSSYLEQAADGAYQQLFGQEGIEICQENENADASSSSIFHSHLKDFTTVSQRRRSDLVNFRIQLWRTLANIVDVAETKSRYFTPLFIRFIESEFWHTELVAAPCEDLTAATAAGESSNDGLQSKERRGERRSAVRRTLRAKLETMSRIHNPYGLFRQPQLWDIYMQLLLSPVPEIASAVLKCIYAYKGKWLTPYREHLDRIIDEKTMKDELVLFNVSTDFDATDEKPVTVIKPEHRTAVLNIVLRLLYGKLFGKSTGAGSNTTSLRRKIILRFVANCQPSELDTFIDLFVHPLKNYIDYSDDPGNVSAFIKDSYDITKSIPLNKLHGLLFMLELIFKMLGSVITARLPQLFRVCAACAVIFRILEQQKLSIVPHNLEMLKKLRSLVIDRFVDFFELFDAYDFTQSELTTLLQNLVFPELEAYPRHSCYSVSGLTRLFIAWGSNSRYFSLLGAINENDSTKQQSCALQAVFRLLLNVNCASSVQSALLDMIYSLLTTTDFVLSENCNQLPSFPSIAVPDDGQQQPDQLNYGTRLILPFLDDLLELIERKASNTKSAKGPSGRVFDILSRICCYVSDPVHCNKVVSLYLPYLEKGAIKSEDAQVTLLDSLYHLVQVASSFLEFLTSFASLLGLITGRKARGILCDIIAVLGKRDQHFAMVADLIIKLNSWDPRRVDEPDYSVRLTAHSTINSMLENESSDCLGFEFLTILMHNFSFNITNIEDMSLRDSATLSLQKLVQYAARNLKDASARNDIISKHLLPILKLGLKHKSETVRNEVVAVARACAIAFADHAKFNGLAVLINTDADLDFFENIKHIQLHRRGRAIRRLAEFIDSSLKENGRVNGLTWECLMFFVMPLIRPFLLDAAYAKNSALLEECVKLFGSICRLLPWPRYRGVLRYYLNRLQKDTERQKYLVKILSAILDAFHFDLTNFQHGSEAITAETNSENAANIEVQDAEVTDNENVPDRAVMFKQRNNKIFAEITKDILPSLKTALNKRSFADPTNKDSTQESRDYDNEMMRIPVALATVKLLQKLPTTLLHSSLPGIFLKICAILRSRSQEVRDTARKTLFEIMKCLGPKYLPYLVKELKAIMTKGYQLHVMSYTVNAVLLNMSEHLRSGDLDPFIKELLEICNDELFGKAAEEKDSPEVARNLMEARARNKSYETYEIVGRFCSKDNLEFVLDPLKQILTENQRHKTVHKVSEVCRHFAQGLALNESLSVDVCLVFAYSLLSENLPMLFPSKNHYNDEDEMEIEKSRLTLKAESVYLITKEPGRAGAAPVTSKKSTRYVLVELALQELLTLLKRNRLSDQDSTHVSMLDPIISLLIRCLESIYPKVVALALRCITGLIRYPLPALRSNFQTFVGQLFILLRQYGNLGGVTKGETSELVLRLFKAVTQVLRDADFYTVQSSQFAVLLQYAEQDIYDRNRQTTSFTLVKAILSRKLESNELHALMVKVRELFVLSPTEHVKQQSRELFLQYLLTYPLGKKIRRHIEFCLTQLEYELEDGRVSVLEVLKCIIERFPQKTLEEYAPLIFLKMSLQLVNDESTVCQKMILYNLKLLLTKLVSNNSGCELLFNMVIAWLCDEEQPRLLRMRQIRLSAELLQLFCEVQPKILERQLPEMLPVITQLLNPSNYANLNNSATELELEGEKVLCQLIRLISAVCRYVPLLARGPQFVRPMNIIWEYVKSFLLDTHTSVKLAASEAFAVVFSQYSSADFCSTSIISKEYLLNKPLVKVQLLCDAFCAQLRQFPLSEELAVQAIKNLVFLAKILVNLKQISALDSANFSSSVRDPDDNRSDTSSESGSNVVVAETVRKTVTLETLAKDLTRMCRIETAKSPKNTVKRSSVFKWIAGIAVDLQVDDLANLAPIILPVLYRELTLADADSELRSLANNVSDLLKSKLGTEAFSRFYAECHRESVKRREERRAERALEVVNDTELAAQKKQKRQKAKQRARKRKIDEMKPYRAKRTKTTSVSE